MTLWEQVPKISLDLADWQDIPNNLSKISIKTILIESNNKSLLLLDSSLIDTLVLIRIVNMPLLHAQIVSDTVCMCGGYAPRCLDLTVYDCLILYAQ